MPGSYRSPSNGAMATTRPCIDERKGRRERMTESVYTLYSRGQEFLDAGRPHQAVVVLERAAAVEPEKGSIREALARALFMTGRFRRARGEFAKAVAIDPVTHSPPWGGARAGAGTGDRPGGGAPRGRAGPGPPRREYREAL